MDGGDHALFAATLLAFISVGLEYRFAHFALLLLPTALAARIPDVLQRGERRASTHSLAFLFGATFAVWFLLESLPAPFGWLSGFSALIPLPSASSIVKAWLLGLASHLMLDALTARGVCLLYPLPFWMTVGLEESSMELKAIIALAAIFAALLRIATSPYLCLQLERFVGALFS